MEKKGCTVTWESSGNQAIETIKNNDFDRVICDLMLQDISGFDVLEESKDKYNITEIGEKFIIITAYSSQQVLNKASTYGSIVLSKPFEDLHGAIDTFIRGKSGDAN